MSGWWLAVLAQAGLVALALVGALVLTLLFLFALSDLADSAEAGRPLPWYAGRRRR